ncbi:SRPBCC family protein [Alteribacter populi]|uniref:SRPBCC family protein n=1 Tax=Alteribacter populi TaxID=2011011 RepID=UPI000BBA4413|nr:SRPBCC family protein [Alteribacter populi]
MADMEEGVMINKPIDDVFSYASNIENGTEMMANVVEVNKLTEGPVGVGTQYEEIRQFSNRKVGAVLEIVHYDAPHAYSVKSANKGLEVVYHYTFSDSGDSTNVLFKGEVHTHGLLMKVLRPIMVRMLKREDAEHLKTLKQVIESPK